MSLQCLGSRWWNWRSYVAWSFYTIFLDFICPKIYSRDHAFWLNSCRLGRSQATAHRFTITVGNDHRASQKVNLTLPSQQPIYPRLSQTIGISAISRFSIDGKICTVNHRPRVFFPTFPSKVPGLLFGLKEDGNFSANVLNEKKNNKRLKIKICLNGCFVILSSRPYLDVLFPIYHSKSLFSMFL